MLRRRKYQHSVQLNPRTRVRWSGNWDTQCQWSVNQTPPYAWLQSGPSLTKYSEMTDYVGNKALWNPVYHFRFNGKAGYRFPCYNQGVTHISPDVSDIILHPDNVKAMCPSPNVLPLKNLSQKTLLKATSWMPEQMSIANFILELREGLKGIIPSVHNFKSCLGGLYLGIKFGTESFLRDLKKFYQSFGELQKRLRYLRLNNGQANWVRGFRSNKYGNSPLVSTDYQVPDDMTIMVDSTDPLNNPAVAHRAVKLHIVPESIVGVVHVNILVYFKHDGLNNFWTKMDMFSAAVGLNNPVKIAWNYARWTWLLEYFVNVQPYLDKLAGQPVKGSIEVRAAWTSVKTTFLLEIYEGQVGSCSLKPGPPVWNKAGEYTVTKYERTPGLTFLTQDDLVGMNLTPQQIAILTALAESRFDWTRTRWTKWAARKWGPWASGAKPFLKGWKTPPRWFRSRFRLPKS